MKILILLLGLFILFITRISGKKSPARIYSLIWVLFCILPSCILWNDRTWNYTGIIWIEISCVFFLMGQLLSYKPFCNTPVIEKKNNKYPLNLFLVKRIITILLFVCIFYQIYNIKRKGFSLSVFYDFKSLIAINAASATERYSGEASSSLFGQLILILVYSLPLIGGFCLPYYNKKSDKILCCLTLFPVFIALAISNAKAGFIASAFGFGIFYLIGNYIVNGGDSKIELKKIVIISSIIFLFILILFISMCLRVGDLSQSTINYIKEKIMIYMFGQMKAFDEWFSEKESATFDFSFGTMTYTWLFNLLKIHERKQGVYGWAHSITTNVFTGFRGIIMDYGSFGGLVFCCLRGFLGGYCYTQIRVKKIVSPIIIAVLASTYFFILYSFIISPWIYFSYVMSYVLFVIILYICGCKEVRYARV